MKGKTQLFIIDSGLGGLSSGDISKGMKK
jgi:hypothetical protein